ncbi:unnamed protein product [Prorocentrum cordatum]|uniref:Uncharacterized protein n=1 Tax=Prorocentrum cordatum TaxID=2364126 RepID=A0ABN9PTY0_9DINO|nr:unnamed protein product [Polarella glacialis]
MPDLGAGALWPAALRQPACSRAPPAAPLALGLGGAALGRHGICRLPVAEGARAALAATARALLEPAAWRRVLATDPGSELLLGAGLPRLTLHNSAGSDRLLWLYARDEQAMGPFDALAAALEAEVTAASRLGGRSLKLCAGSFVVLRSPGARDSEVFPHRDWDEAVLGARSAFTALVPLVLPEGSAGLEVFGPGGGLEGVVQYALGEAVVFDNARLHPAARELPHAGSRVPELRARVPPAVAGRGAGAAGADPVLLSSRRRVSRCSLRPRCLRPPGFLRLL